MPGAHTEDIRGLAFMDTTWGGSSSDGGSDSSSSSGGSSSSTGWGARCGLPPLVLMSASGE